MSRFVGIRIRALSALALPLATACARPPLLPAPTGAARCTVPGVGTAEAQWRVVRATGLTFCVPPHWRPDGPAPRGADAMTWYGDNGSITWGAPPSRILTREVILAVPVQRGTPLDVESLGFPPPRTTPLNFQYDVDGLTIATSQRRCQGTFWSTASIGGTFPQLTGEARGGAAASVQMAIFRTIRLAPRTP
jgi:hypothetical protein